ncbi:hypothetical protein GobsT_67660 [Gemmata obscuriglobus]|uniref:Uncharacterized protein n=1 Tax=Gemmata obscuriglobus TaxID=114 RepID=A0A2Z3GU18_9BACT|nr:hypothetical protein [Gemmata obscuriglobus]AWM35562.1 hypothetical protein C1280_00010 [Gemmata obscuriglobus]QEG31919.1 hypothetical protein GobsT_67660 [Gemmata obscuriglobus]VTS11265.1 Uncharacterized protein OS=Haliangium ochraceum (strain DSM 14365 / JCM 11303 / SMP-2) GN=Hoch_4851 PE=4 SV=1 [Gemmata obscuriglobus UQM 2246]
MVRKWGWWGAAYREAVFRLADHAQSAAEQIRDAAPAPVATGWVSRPALASRAEGYALPLTGLDGANPLAFLAALGTLRLAERAYPGTRLSWKAQGSWTPVLHLPQEITPTALIANLLAQAVRTRRCVTFAQDVKILAEEFCAFEREARLAIHTDREFSEFLVACANPLVTIQGGPNAGKTKPTEFYFIAGQQKLLKQALEIATAATQEHLTKALFAYWTYDDPLEGLSLRWDPRDDLRYATRFHNPSKDKSKGKKGSVLGANRLAFEALPLFPCFARGSRLVTTGFLVLDRRPFFTWPIWEPAWGLSSVRSVLGALAAPRDGSEVRHIKTPDQIGVTVCYQCEKVSNSDYSNFTPSRAL